MLHSEGDGHESDGHRRNFNRALMRGGQRIDDGFRRRMCGSKMFWGGASDWVLNIQYSDWTELEAVSFLECFKRYLREALFINSEK